MANGYSNKDTHFLYLLRDKSIVFVMSIVVLLYERPNAMKMIKVYSVKVPLQRVQQPSQYQHQHHNNSNNNFSPRCVIYSDINHNYGSVEYSYAFDYFLKSLYHKL